MLEKIKNLEKGFLFNTYQRYPLEIVKGEGVWVYDSSGKRYCDFLSGISVCNLGHSHPEINEVIKNQIQTLTHISNLFYQAPQIELAQKLLDSCNMDKVFFCNSGAEANEAAIKLVRRFMQCIKKEKRYKIITIEGSFHGRTLATLAATGQSKVKEGFEPLPVGFLHIPLNDVISLKQNIDEHTAAIMVEIIQGEGGVKPLKDEFLMEIQKICKTENILLVVDEIQTGLGRTGSFWAYQHLNLDPDIITSAKALGNGLPIGAMMAKDFLADAFSVGTHGSTFGGGPLVCKVASKVFDIIKRDQLESNAKKLGESLINSLNELHQKFSEKIVEVRGKGLMVGIEMKNSDIAKKTWEKLLDRGFITNITQQNTIRLLPPLIIQQNEIFSFIENLDFVLTSI